MVPVHDLSASGHFGAARDTLRRTAFNRRVSGVVLFAFVAQVVWVSGAWPMGLAPEPTTVVFVFLWFVVTALAAIVLEHRMAPAALGYLAAFLVAARWPEWKWCAMSVSQLALTVNPVVIGAPPEEVQAGVQQVRERIAARHPRARP